MFEHLSLYLEKFKNHTKNNTVLKNEVVAVVKKHSGISLTQDEVRIQKTGIFLKTNPAKKSEIFLSKQKILNEFTKHSSTQNITSLY